MTPLDLSVLEMFSSPVFAHAHVEMVHVHCLQPDDAGEWDQIDAPTAELLFRFAPFLEDKHYQLILDRKCPELHGFTPVSIACHLNLIVAIPLICPSLLRMPQCLERAALDVVAVAVQSRLYFWHTRLRSFASAADYIGNSVTHPTCSALHLCCADLWKAESIIEDMPFMSKSIRLRMPRASTGCMRRSPTC